MIFPAVALKGTVFFPGNYYNITVGREKSVKAIEESFQNDRLVFFVAQKDEDIEIPTEQDLFTTGVVCKVKQMIKKQDDTRGISLDALYRAKIVSFNNENEDFIEVDIEKIEDIDNENDSVKLSTLFNYFRKQFHDFAKNIMKLSKEMIATIEKIEDMQEFSYMVSNLIHTEIDEKQELLDIESVERRLEKLISIMKFQEEIKEVEKKIEEAVKSSMDKNQLEYYFREKIKAINEELGDSDDPTKEVEEWSEKLKNLNMPKESREKVEKEIKKYSMIKASSPDSAVTRNYIETILELPWNDESKEIDDLKVSEEILQKDHYGLEKVKERVLEHLAVLHRKKDQKSPILCLVGPPGTGKTSIAKSIAKATGREFIRMSLGGVRDEAEIRGHRRTYIGAIPGRIINSIKNKTKNPVFLLDEIDKLGSDYKGDPSSALLEVLDPEQNKDFVDHYLEIPFDLSKVMFVTTANTLDTIPRPLRDRMEIIPVYAYTKEEKVQIAKKYLVPKKLEEMGTSKSEISISEKTLKDLIDYYTKEAGVRNLEREIASIIRKSIKKIELDGLENIKLKPSDLEKLLGKKKFRYDKIDGKSEVGVATGMAWTAVGGDTLFVETTVVAGTGKLSLTGQLGNVMQESAKTAITYVRSVCKNFDIDEEFYKNKDIHIHVPEGAVPKDGPSAGVTMAVSIISALSNIPVRKDVSMTGEVNLRGKVLAVGGIKEKVLAAHRAGVKKILLPFDNERDIDDIPKNVRDELEFVLLKEVNDALKEVLVK